MPQIQRFYLSETCMPSRYSVHVCSAWETGGDLYSLRRNQQSDTSNRSLGFTSYFCFLAGSTHTSVHSYQTSIRKATGCFPGWLQIQSSLLDFPQTQHRAIILRFWKKDSLVSTLYLLGQENRGKKKLERFSKRRTELRKGFWLTILTREFGELWHFCLWILVLVEDLFNLKAVNNGTYFLAGCRVTIENVRF